MLRRWGGYLEGGGTNGSHLPADMTCRDVGHGSVALLRARRYRSEQLLSGTVEESIVARGLRAGLHCRPVCTLPAAARPRQSSRAGGTAESRRSCSRRQGPASSCLPPAATHDARAPRRSTSPSPRAAPGQLPRGVSYRSLPSHVPRGALHPRDPPLAGLRRLRGAHVATIRSTPTARPRYPSPRLAP